MLTGEQKTVLRERALSLLGADLLALYHEPAGRAWFVLRDEAELEPIRQVWHPLAAADPGAFGHGPAVLTPADFHDYQLLFAPRLQGLSSGAELLAGEDWLAGVELSPPDPLLALAQEAAELLRCSTLLAGASADGEPERRLAALQAAYGLPAGGRLTERLAALHAVLAARQDEHPEYAWQGGLPRDEPPPHLPGLLALFELDHELIVVMPQVDAKLLAQIDWPAVAMLVADEFERVMLATPWQLRLVASVCKAIDLFMAAFQRVWGVDVLADCRPLDRHLWLSAALLPAEMLVERCPADYCVTPDQDLAMFVHDLQNVQLNIQLRQEVLSRRTAGSHRRQAEPLPGRDAPVHDRVAANRLQFRWWLRAMLSSAAQLA